MKQVLIILIKCILLIVTSSCQSKQEADFLPIINIASNIKNMQKIYLSQFADSIWYVPLESNIEHSLLFVGKDLEISDKYILAADNTSCNLYDSRGNFIRKIGKKGRGPAEYTFINGIGLTKDRIYIRDMYDLNEFTIDGEFIKKYSKCFLVNNIYVKDILMLNDTMIFAYIDNPSGNTEDKAVIITKSGEVIHKFKNYVLFDLEPGVTDSRGVENAIFYKFDDNLVYKDPHIDTLFNLNKKFQLIPVYVCNLGKYKSPPSERGKAMESIVDPTLTNFISAKAVFQTNNYLFLPCNFNKHFPAKRLTPEIIPLPTGRKLIRWYNTQGVLGIFDKRTGTLIFSEPTSTDNKLYTSGLYNDIDAGPRFFPIKQINNSTMVMTISAKDLKNHIASNDFKNSNPKYSEKKKELEELANNLSESDNPVFMFVTFKTK